MSFELAAIGRPGAERRYEVTDEALRAYADATDDVPGGPVFAIVPVWETIAPASRSVASDEARRRVVHYEQWVTEFFRGVETDASIGERAPDHRLEVDSAEPVAEIAYPVAEDQTVRYAAASGDDFAIHLDDAFARKVGLPGRIVHGLCTMAFAGRAVLEAAGVDDPRAIVRLAVRFAAPLFPGDMLTTRVWRVEGGYGFEALSGDGTTVLKDGRAELR